MRIRSSLIPQADVLQDVIRVVEGVYGGARSFQDISHYIGKVERQGRYYRLAAEILGFIKNEHNYSRLTALGRRLITSSAQEKESLKISAVLDARIFQRLVPFFELHPEGVIRKQIETFMAGVTERVGPTMLHRRVSSVLSWLESVNIIYNDNGKYKLTRQKKTLPLVEFKDDAEPLMPKTGDLREYKEVQARMSAARTSIIVFRNRAASDRAHRAHIQLVNLVAARVRQAGSLPRSNHFIDLASRVNDKPYIFEMKSITLRNARLQIRHGLSQLLEYRYLQDLPEANLVLVIEKPLPSDDSWMKDYLEKGMKIELVWDGDDELYASTETRENLSFLWPS